MTDGPEYQKFVDDMVKHCRCRHPFDRPCAGVLAGGLCDNLGPTHETEYDDDNDDDAVMPEDDL